MWFTKSVAAGAPPGGPGPLRWCLLSLELQRLGDRRGGCTTVGVPLSEYSDVVVSTCYKCSWCMSGERPGLLSSPPGWTGSSGVDRSFTVEAVANFAPCFCDGGPYFPVRADCTLPCWMTRVPRGSARAFDGHCCSCVDMKRAIGRAWLVGRRLHWLAPVVPVGRLIGWMTLWATEIV